MKRTLTFIFAALMCIGTATLEAAAQDYVSTPVTVSTQKVRQNGKLYYSHIVLERQTLFSIAKAYGVTVDDIYAANDGLRENGLKTNSIILIPASSTTGADSAEPAAPDAGKYENTPISAADAASKASSDGGRTTKKAAKNNANKKNYFIHTVKWYEDLDMISGKYGVSTAILMKVNGMTTKKVTSKQQLKIPTNPEDWDVVEPAAASGAAAGQSSAGTPAQAGPQTQPGSETSSEPAGTATADTGQPSDSAAGTVADTTAKPGWTGWGGGVPFFRNKTKITASLLLPFNASGETPSELSMDFYSGALMAARKLSSEGVSLNLNVFDTYGNSLTSLNDNIGASDLVIGLLTADGFTTLLNNFSTNTYFISPLDYRTESLAETNGNFIQCSNSMSAQYADLAKWIGEDLGPEDRVTVIHESGVQGVVLMEEVSPILNSQDYSYEDFSYTILEGRGVTESLERIFTPEGMNRVLVASENEAFVNDVVRNLNLMIHSKYDVTLYGGSKIRSFETIDVENLHNTSFHCSLTFNIDYDDPKVRQFLMEYRALFNTEPSQTAFQGYDTLYYFATMLHNHGGYMGAALTDTTVPGLMSDFRFTRVGAGLVRTATRRAVYEPDCSVIYLK